MIISKAKIELKKYKMELRARIKAWDALTQEAHLKGISFNVDNVFQLMTVMLWIFVGWAPTAQTMFMANLSSADPVYDEAGPSYDSGILSEVHDHDHYQDVVCKHHEEHEMHDDVQPNYVVDSHANYTSDSNMISPFYVSLLMEVVPVVQLSIVFCSKMDAYMMSQDLIKMKEEALKKQTTASRPIKALMVHPPNTPATLVHRVLPTKRLTKGERGFKQTKECYLAEVIPFFKTLKEHFKGIQKALTKEIKEMKDIFEELETEVDQNVVNRKHDEIERKNLL
ncbi:hypothetical protein Tco_1459303 [Tanacetum coccineum]